MHPDVRAAATANLAKWEELRAKAHAGHGAKDAKGGGDGKDVKATMALAGPVATAPGAKPLAQYGLWQVPTQTTAASPPLPPGVTLPTAADIRKIAGQVPDAADVTLSNSVRTHLATAAQKMSSGDQTGALHSLRAAQASIRAAHQADLAAGAPSVAAVFDTTVPPAEVSSARSEMLASRDKAQQWRGLEHQVAVHVDTLRRAHFHGQYGGLAEARFAREGTSMTCLDKVLRLAAGDDSDDGDPPDTGASAGMIYLAVPPSLVPAGLTIPRPHVTVVYLGPDISDTDFQAACERARAAAKATPPVHGVIGGLGLFPASSSSDGTTVAYAQVHADGIYHLRQLLADLSASAHPFQPHFTLAKLQPGEDPPAPLTSAKVCFSQLFVARGDQVCAFALTGQHSAHGGLAASDSALGKVLALAGAPSPGQGNYLSTLRSAMSPPPPYSGLLNTAASQQELAGASYQDQQFIASHLERAQGAIRDGRHGDAIDHLAAVRDHAAACGVSGTGPSSIPGVMRKHITGIQQDIRNRG